MSALLAWLIFPAISAAGDLQPFDGKLFDALQAQNKPVVFVVHASWRPARKGQKSI